MAATVKITNYVGQVQELCSKFRFQCPDFTFEGSGPSHLPSFICTATFKSASGMPIVTTGPGSTKKIAKDAACEKMYAELVKSMQSPTTSTRNATSLPRTPSPPRMAISQANKENHVPSISGMRSHSVPEIPRQSPNANLPVSHSLQSFDRFRVPEFNQQDPFESLEALCEALGWTKPKLTLDDNGSLTKVTVRAMSISGTMDEMSEARISRSGTTYEIALTAACRMVYTFIVSTTFGLKMHTTMNSQLEAPVSPSTAQAISTVVEFDEIPGSSPLLDKAAVAFAHYAYISRYLKLDCGHGNEFDELVAFKRVAREMSFNFEFIRFLDFRQQHMEPFSYDEESENQPYAYLLTCVMRMKDQLQSDINIHGMGRSQPDAQKDAARNTLRYIRLMIEYRISGLSI